MLMDFSAVKQAMKDIIDELLDHYDLNEQLAEPNVTAEYLAKFLYLELSRKLLDTPEFLACHGKLSRITIWESPECCVKYCQLPMKETNHVAGT
jgi:6-pyruvoyl-tetrahydropterin synthase